MADNKIPPPVFIDPNIARKRRLVNAALESHTQQIVLPGVVEISESGTCNRKCSFCPRSAPDYEDIKEFVDPALLEKLFSQLAQLDYDGLVIYSGFVEPMLDKKIFEKLALTRRLLPDSKIELISNGDPLNIGRVRKLFDCGLSTLLISVYDGPEDEVRLGQMCENAGLSPEQYVIRNRYLPPEQDFGITMSNRGGMMDNTEYVRPSLSKSLEKTCFYPGYMFFMDYQGDVLVCSHDWGKKKIVGNMTDSDFLDIWLSDNMLELRKELSQASRNNSPCNVCDVRGTFIGRDHALAWARLGQYEIVDDDALAVD